jgi:hypothetical protein
MTKKVLVDAIFLEMVMEKLNELPRKDVQHIFALGQGAVQEYNPVGDADLQALGGMPNG